MDSFLDVAERKVAVVGLGYVGLPLAVEFGKIRPLIAFDINASRIAELKQGYDATMEISSTEFKEAKFLSFTTEVKDIAFCTVFIITVPTPIDSFKRPDFSLLIRASLMIAALLKQARIKSQASKSQKRLKLLKIPSAI